MGRSSLALALLLAALAPVASAVPVAFALDHADKVALAGDAAVRFPEGAMRLVDPHASGRGVGRGLTGELRVLTWTAATSPSEDVDFRFRVGDVETTTYRLSDATLDVALGGQALTFVAVAGPGGALEVRGAVDDRGEPKFLPAPETPPLQGQWPGADEEDVEWTWEEGWPFLGDFPTSAGRAVGFPSLPEGTALVTGPARIKLHGAVLSFTDAEGHAREVATGESRASSPDGLVTETLRRAIFEGTVASLEMPLGGEWGAAAPTMSWSLAGEASWMGARGWVEQGGERAPVADHLTLAGTLDAAVGAPPHALATGTYAGSGDVDVLILDGAPREAPAPPASVDVAAWTLAALVAWLLSRWGQEAAGKLVAAAYTRISPGNALDHPLRAGIYQAVAASPGVHLREIHRRVGGAWGAFSFHVAVLRRGRIIALRKDGRHLRAFPAGATDAGPVLHASAKRLHQALVAAGAPLRVGDLADRAGLSRQLAAHHLRALEAQGIVRSRVEAGARWIELAQAADGAVAN